MGSAPRSVGVHCIIYSDFVGYLCRQSYLGGDCFRFVNAVKPTYLLNYLSGTRHQTNALSDEVEVLCTQRLGFG